MRSGELVDGRFRLAEQIGSGGMGVVFRAVDEHAGAMVALKLIDGRSTQDIERARREAEVLARLWHPAIVRYVAEGVVAGDQLYLVMEWVDGITAADRIAQDGFTVRESLALARRIADALACAHAADVLHRDLKPSNVMLSGDEFATAKLIDFGVARVGDATTTLTRTGAAIGTPGYMSPEQARGERNLTPASDVFGLGCVLYECMTATPAFSGVAVAAVMAKILFADPTPLTNTCSEVSPAVVALVQRMLAKSAGDRYADCRAVVAAIDAIGAIPDGPRRSSRRLTADATQISRAVDHVHCIVAAARTHADEPGEPPLPMQQAVLMSAAQNHNARLEILATGAAIAHLSGTAKDVSHRAALLALAMRRVLPDWSVAISSLQADPHGAADHGTALLTSHALAAIFGVGASDTIVVDPATAGLLKPDFEIGTDHGHCTLLRDTRGR